MITSFCVFHYSRNLTREAHNHSIFRLIFDGVGSLGFLGARPNHVTRFLAIETWSVFHGHDRFWALRDCVPLLCTIDADRPLASTFATTIFALALALAFALNPPCQERLIRSGRCRRSADLGYQRCRSAPRVEC